MIDKNIILFSCSASLCQRPLSKQQIYNPLYKSAVTEYSALQRQMIINSVRIMFYSGMFRVSLFRFVLLHLLQCQEK
jgi:hypothetical protein